MKKRLPIILSILIIIGCVGYIIYECTTDFIVKKTILFIREDAALQEDVQKIIDSHMPVSENNEEGTTENPVQSENSLDAPSKGNAENNEETAKKTQTPVYSKGEDGVLSIDDLQPSDKSYVMSIYYRFSASEVNTVSQMMADGITTEEKQTIKQIVYAKVSRAEVDTLFAIARKYQ